MPHPFLSVSPHMDTIELYLKTTDCPVLIPGLWNNLPDHLLILNIL